MIVQKSKKNIQKFSFLQKSSKIDQKMSLKFGFLVLFVSSIVLIVNSAYLDNQPKWNWEEVILSRNGPSTTTTPRPKFWSEFKTNFHFQTSPFQLQNCFKFVLLVLMVIKVGIPSWYLPRQSFWKMCNRVLNGVNHEDFHISKSGQRYRFGYRMHSAAKTYD